MPAKYTSISPEQVQMIQLLALGKTQAEAAAELGISARTVARWLESPHVREMYETLRADMAVVVQEEIKKLASTAVTALRDSLTSARAPMVKFSAATYVLNRVAPESALQNQSEASGPVPAELLPYVLEDELAQIDAILARAQERKREAEEKITPIRKQA